MSRKRKNRRFWLSVDVTEWQNPWPNWGFDFCVQERGLMEILASATTSTFLLFVRLLFHVTAQTYSLYSVLSFPVLYILWKEPPAFSFRKTDNILKPFLFSRFNHEESLLVEYLTGEPEIISCNTFTDPPCSFFVSIETLGGESRAPNSETQAELLF